MIGGLRNRLEIKEWTYDGLIHRVVDNRKAYLLDTGRPSMRCNEGTTVQIDCSQSQLAYAAAPLSDFLQYFIHG